MSTKIFEIQQKIFSTLTNSEQLMEIVTGVYDYVPENAETPYVTFSRILSTSDTTKTNNGSEKLSFFIEIWSQSKGRKEVVQVLSLVEQLLEPEFVMDSIEVIEQKAMSREVAEEAYGLYHATLEFQIII